jgi:hypothetical protein
MIETAGEVRGYIHVDGHFFIGAHVGRTLTLHELIDVAGDETRGALLRCVDGWYIIDILGIEVYMDEPYARSTTHRRFPTEEAARFAIDLGVCLRPTLLDTRQEVLDLKRRLITQRKETRK